MGGGNAQQTAMMSKIMKYFFPIMILWFARTYPAGLALYWFRRQVIQIFYNIRFNKLKKAQRDAKQAKAKEKIRCTNIGGKMNMDFLKNAQRM